MAALDDTGFDVGHPAPHRDRVRQHLLALSLLMAPLAWSAQLLLSYGFASYACGFGRLQPSGAPAADWLQWVLPLANVAGLLAAALAIGLSFASLRRTGEEHEDQSGSMLDAGEGRTRFLALWGLGMGVVFLLAIAFNTLAVYWSGLCTG